MELTLPKENILKQLVKQLSNFFEIAEEDICLLQSCMDEVLNMCEYNFEHSDNKYYKSRTGGRFDTHHSVQYMIFLYYLSNLLYRQGGYNGLCDKVYYLNKIMNGVDLFYAIELPPVFGAEHPLGSVMGRAKYGEGFFFYQGCTVGGTMDNRNIEQYPIIGKNVTMYANSSILGNCTVGDNVNIGAGAIVKNQDIPANSIVFGQSPNLIVKQKKANI